MYYSEMSEDAKIVMAFFIFMLLVYVPMAAGEFAARASRRTQRALDLRQRARFEDDNESGASQ